jgi:hypothetical protein
VSFDPSAVSGELTRLWDRGSHILWALAVAAFVGFVALAAAALTGSPPFVQLHNMISPWLLLASIVLATLAAIRQYQERGVRTVGLFPIEAQSFCHRAVQTDGRVLTQLAIRMEVFNITDKSIWLPSLRLLRPRPHGLILQKMLVLREQSSDIHGGYELPSGAKTTGAAHLMIEGDITDTIERRGATLLIQDQFGHRHKLTLPKVRKT